jgi:hypothetical protein
MDPRERKLQTPRRRQRGLFTLAQALDAGYTRPAVRRRLHDRVWREVDTRVYRVVNGVPDDSHQMLLARVMATGGVACGESAAALFGLIPFPATPQILAARSMRTRTHVGVQFSSDLPDSDIALVDGIPATRPARTVIELATTTPSERFEDVLDGAIVGKLVTMDRLEKRARELRAPNRPGCAIVLGLLADRHPELSGGRATRWKRRCCGHWTDSERRARA